MTYNYSYVYNLTGLTKDQALKVAEAVGLGDRKEETADMLMRLYGMFIKKDALLIEVNPYAEDASGKCKMAAYNLRSFH